MDVAIELMIHLQVTTIAPTTISTKKSRKGCVLPTWWEREMLLLFAVERIEFGDRQQRCMRRQERADRFEQNFGGRIAKKRPNGVVPTD